MEIYTNIKIERITAQVKTVNNRSDNILAFGTLLFYEANNDVPVLKVTGITIRKFNHKLDNSPFTRVVFPGFKAGFNFITSFVIDNKELYKAAIKLLQDEYNQQVGDAGKLILEEVNIDEIPI